MKYLAFFLVAIFLLPAGFTQAATINDCDANTLQCRCPPGIPPDYLAGLDGYFEGDALDCEAQCNEIKGSPATYRQFGGQPPEGYVLQCAIGGIATAIAGDSTLPTSSADQAVRIEEVKEPIIPQLSIPIPGISEEDFRVVRENGEMSTNFIAIYIRAIYQLLLGLSAFIAVVVFVTSGLQWLLAGGDSGSISAAKTRMEEAILGIVLILSAYTIGYLLDPRVLEMDFLTIKALEPIEYEGENWDFSARLDIPLGYASVETSPGLIVATNETHLVPEAYDSLLIAVEDFKNETGLSAKLTSASRTVLKQAELFYEHCLSQPGRACRTTVACNPASGTSIITGNSRGYTLTGALANVTDKNVIIQSIEAAGDQRKCPHTSGVAVDLWCGSGVKAAYDPECQQKLTEIMAEYGWCRLDIEPWHFEYNEYALSKSRCSMNATKTYYRSGRPIDPGTCKSWNFLEDKCND